MLDKSFYFFLLGFANTAEGLLGLISGEIYVRQWFQVSILEAWLWLLSGIVLLYIGMRTKRN